jgi:DNA-binding transcriptional LysR family regulator
MDLLSQMATFIRIVEAGSLSAAARSQNLSLPAISRQLRDLEEQLGGALVLRTTRSLQVTEAGRVWYAHCVRILREIDEARRSVNNSSTLGILTISAPVTIGMHCVVPNLLRLAQQSPNLSVNLRLEDNFVDLIAEGVDVAVRAGIEMPDSPSLIARPLRQFRRILVAAPSYLSKNVAPAHPEALRGHACVLQLSESKPLNVWRLRHKEEEHEVEVEGRVRATAPMALREAALAGLGVAFLPEWLVQEDIAAKRLRRLLSHWEGAPITIWALYRVELRNAPRVQAFLEAMQ